MDSQTISEWLISLSTVERLRALALLYSHMTVGTREMFLPGMANGREHAILYLLHGINELHHTVANQVTAYSLNNEGFPPDVFAEQLVEIANQYGIGDLLTRSVEFARSRNVSTKA